VLHPFSKHGARATGIVLAIPESDEENIMIIRVFRPTIHPGRESEFESFVRDTAVSLVSRQAGLVAQHVGRSRDPSSSEYVYVTIWEDFDSIRAFAGERWQEAVITPDEEQFLKDTWIGHYEALPIPGPAARG
jgi:heme-degrading monooxygenase HmoA